MFCDNNNDNGVIVCVVLIGMASYTKPRLTIS